MPAKQKPVETSAALRRRAEAELRSASPPQPAGDPRRLLHELQAHQIQLEMQNEELRDAREHLEASVEKYTDLYDFAPVGYFSLDEMGRIQEVNLTGATMLQVERSKLLQRRFAGFVSRDHLPTLETFLQDVFASADKQVCELAIETGSKRSVWVDLQATKSAFPVDGSPRCRIAVSDISARKRAAVAQLRVEELEALNIALEDQVARRKASEESLRESRRKQARMLTESKRMQKELRMLSHQILHTQEEERKRISHDLHDEIAQTLVAINLHLAELAHGAALNPEDITKKVTATQKLVEQSVASVHRFAMDLRPKQLDDFGFFSALRSYIKEFSQQNEIPVRLSGARQLKPIEDAPAVALFRVAQAALTNVAQHANATQVTIELHQNQRSVRMVIRDDGKSFDVEKALNDTKKTGWELSGCASARKWRVANLASPPLRGRGPPSASRCPSKNPFRTRTKHEYLSRWAATFRRRRQRMVLRGYGGRERKLHT